MKSLIIKSLIILLIISTSSCSSNTNKSLKQGLYNKTISSKFTKDREAILKLAGTYKVTFRFQETISFVKGYKIKEPYKTSAYEVIKVIENKKNKISLQHVLVAKANNKQFAIKHWRQDWTYEPKSLLVFIGGNAWKKKEVRPENRIGAWSQTVYQVDDSPRYGAIGKWSHEAGISEWTPSPEWRPLPRRDMTKRNDYHAIKAINRHVITPNGWVHEEDNSKLILNDGIKLLAREVGVNTYTRNNKFQTTIADQYIDDTKPFWMEIRNTWKILEDSPKGFKLTLKGEPEELYIALLSKAEEYLVKKITLDQALSEAKEIIKNYTTTRIDSLNSRIRNNNP